MLAVWNKLASFQSGRVSRLWAGRSFGWLEAGFLAIVLAALVMRLFDLGERTMHYDEAIHVHYSWRLLNSDGALWGWPWIFGRDYIHSPWMHGPFQIEFTALMLRIFGDTDVAARLGYVFFGTALVALPYFFRAYLGRTAALLTGLMLTVSPALLYFSRFGRNDVLMAFWATALFILMWRYLHEGHRRYLFLASAVVAFMFATKESAYVLVLILGGIMLLLAIPNLVPWALGRARLSELTGPAGVVLLLGTLTLPLWSPLLAWMIQDPLGLELVNPDGVTGGLVGASHWAAPFVQLPVYQFAWWLHLLAIALGVTLIFLIASFSVGVSVRSTSNLGVRLAVAAAPLAGVGTIALAIYRPVSRTWQTDVALAADLLIAGLFLGVAVAALILTREPWRRGALWLVIPSLVAAVYAVVFTSVLNVDSAVHGVLPSGISVDASVNAVPVNFVVSAAFLLSTLVVSIYLGTRWLGGAWLACAAIFYGIWTTLYTTWFINPAGIFSGAWQGLGYWIAQQGVARGNQPWYYYFVGLSIYELLPFIFGIAAAVYFLRRADILGLALAAWALLSLLAYTLASEKMPWLLVGVSLPFIFVTGKCLGEMVERVRWRMVLQRGQIALLFLPPLMVVASVYLVKAYVSPEQRLGADEWVLLAGILWLAVGTAYFMRISRPRQRSALAVLGIAALLLGYGVTGALRTTYTYHDSNLELLVYAQGSKDLQDTYQQLEAHLATQGPASGEVRVDYEMWYPFNWYVRNLQRDGRLKFSCFKEDKEEGWNQGCKLATEQDDASALLLDKVHGERDAEALTQFQQEGPLRNLLWFNEDAYRRPGENRNEEPFGEQLKKDFQYFKSAVTKKKSWEDTLDYLIYRDLDVDWYTSEFFTFIKP